MNVCVSPQWMRYDVQQTRFRNRTEQMEPVNITRGHISRRHFLQAFSCFAANTALASGADIQRSSAGARSNDSVEYGRSTLPRGVRSRRVDTNNGVVLHILEAGFETPDKPCVVLLHGFPELAYTWRHQLLPLAGAGFHVIAPDLRGYGRSVSTAVTFDDDLLPYSAFEVVVGTRACQDADVLHHGSRQRDGRNSGRGNALQGPDQRMQMAHRRRSSGLRHGVHQNWISRWS